MNFSVEAQLNKYGVPLIRNFDNQITHSSDYHWSIAKDKTGVLYLGSDTRGIIRYDGQTWSTIPVPGEPVIRALGVSDEGVIYVGGSYEFGYLQPSRNGSMEYVSLSNRLNKKAAGEKNESTASDTKSQIGEINTLIVTDTVIYFIGFESCFLYYPAADRIDFIDFRNMGLKQVVKGALINGRIFIADNIRGILELRDRQPVQPPGGDFFSRKISLVLLPYDETSLFVGTHFNGVFRYDYITGKVYETPPVSNELNEILKNSQLYTSQVCPSGEILLGTLAEGIFILDKNFRFIGKWDTETSDLPDNTITAFYSDKEYSSEIWVSTAGYVSKILTNLPFNELTPRSGYEGIVNNIASFNNTIFLATDLGLFKSYVDNKGYLKFNRVSDINQQSFSLYLCKLRNEEFLLVGTILGLYQIFPSGKIIKVDDVISYGDEARKTTYSVRSILQSKVNPERFYIGLSTKGFIIIEYNGKSWKFIDQIKTNIEGNITSIIENKNGDIFILTGNPAGFYHFSLKDKIPVKFSDENFIMPNSITKVDDDIVIATVKGLFRFNEELNSWVPCDDLLNGFTRDVNCKDLYQDSDGDLWLSVIKDKIFEIYFSRDSSKVKMFTGALNLLPGVEKMDLKQIDNKIWIPKSKNIYVIDKEKLKAPVPKINTLLTRIVIGKDSLFMSGTFYKALAGGKRVSAINNSANPIPEIKYNFNSVSFYWSVPYYVEEDKNLYSYKLDGFDRSWSKWENIHYKDFTNLPFGKYTFRVKGKTTTDVETEEVAFVFIILKPWYLTTVMIILYAIAFVLLIIGIIKAYTRKLKNENIRLEGIIAERTAVVVKQKEELESSIHYARRIQMALLPSESILAENLKNYFILFKPRDIVSGDFYWMTKKDNRLYIVAADCTGHGVPGAFMSLLGMSFLDEIIGEGKAPRADEVLSELRLHVTESLKQSGGEDEAKDGMDMALLVIDFNRSRVEFSGAYNPCFRVRRLTEKEQKDYHEDNIEMPDGSMTNGVYILETIFASKMPIGISSKMDEKFVFYDWELEKGVSYYLFSDGYIDQFGGPHGRKFMKKNFKKLILEIQDFPMKHQKEILEERLKEWMGQTPQIDDILVVGIRTD
ncbi:MAG TPA: SpoIIE family protein phosphatase [Bacteroidales bacterium]|nr:SpoIIE family protein phosphatase [Bacteroidales bacterium]